MKEKKTLKIAGISIWRILTYFIIYSIVGYIIETLFGLFTKGMLESRKGFLYESIATFAIFIILTIMSKKRKFKGEQSW